MNDRRIFTLAIWRLLGRKSPFIFLTFSQSLIEYTYQLSAKLVALHLFSLAALLPLSRLPFWNHRISNSEKFAQNRVRDIILTSTFALPMLCAYRWTGPVEWPPYTHRPVLFWPLDMVMWVIKLKLAAIGFSISYPPRRFQYYWDRLSFCNVTSFLLIPPTKYFFYYIFLTFWHTFIFKFKNNMILTIYDWFENFFNQNWS